MKTITNILHKELIYSFTQLLSNSEVFSAHYFRPVCGPSENGFIEYITRDYRSDIKTLLFCTSCSSDCISYDEFGSQTYTLRDGKTHLQLYDYQYQCPVVSIIALFLLNIYGFKDDTVILEINNKEVFKEENITSDPTIALAKTLTINISSGEVNLKVNIITKNLVGNYKFTIDSETYLGISIIEPESPNKKKVLSIKAAFYIFLII